MYIHHLTFLVMFLPWSWYGKENDNFGNNRLNVHLLFRVFQHQILVFIKEEIIFVIALSNNNQWTVEWHTWLPYKTNQFHVQHDFLFSSKRPVLVRAWSKKCICQQSNFNYCLKVLSMKKYFDKYKNKKCTPKSVLRWEFASVYINLCK